MTRRLEDFAYTGPHGLILRPFGEAIRDTCPVCGSGDVGNVFRLPMAAIDPPVTVFGGYFNQIPVLRTPFEIFAWDLCRHCNSIYLNPSASRERINASYRASVSYLKRMADPSAWAGHEERYDALLRFAPASAETLIDAACGGGHTLFLAQGGRGRQWQRLIGLELSESYVANLREHGIEAHQFDLDRDEHQAVVTPGSVDLVSFQEAFEHVERPLAALAKLLDMLRPGGRLYFSAQRYGDDVNLALLAGEPIYIGQRVIDLLPWTLPCAVVDVEKYGPRYLIAIERTEAPVTATHLSIGLPATPAGTMTAAPPPPRREVPPVVGLSGPFLPELGHCFTVGLAGGPRTDRLLAMADGPGTPERSALLLLENGVPVGRPHAAHDDIRNRGGGLFSHWQDTLYFSTPDNSDPNTNGRVYGLVIE